MWSVKSGGKSELLYTFSYKLLDGAYHSNVVRKSGWGNFYRLSYNINNLRKLIICMWSASRGSYFYTLSNNINCLRKLISIWMWVLLFLITFSTTKKFKNEIAFYNPKYVKFFLRSPSPNPRFLKLVSFSVRKVTKIIEGMVVLIFYGFPFPRRFSSLRRVFNCCWGKNPVRRTSLSFFRK